MATDEQPVHRCGHPTKSGAPCRNRVDRCGRPCRLHMKAALLERILGRGDAEDEMEPVTVDGPAPASPAGDVGRPA